jgi:hypothetical protein
MFFFFVDVKKKKKKKERKGEGNRIPSHFNPWTIKLTTLPWERLENLFHLNDDTFRKNKKRLREDYYMTCTTKIIELICWSLHV